MKKLFLTIISILLVQLTFAGNSRCSNPKFYEGSNKVYCDLSPRTSSVNRQHIDKDLLNLKNERVNAISASQPISITEVEFDALASPGNTWLTYFDENQTITINVGQPNLTTAQTWNLPQNLMSVISLYSREDFIDPSAVPASLKIAGATHVKRSYFEDENGYTGEAYTQFKISATGVIQLGTSYDFNGKEDDNFDEQADIEYADVPFDLEDSYETTYEYYDSDVDACLYKEEIQTDINAFGTIVTPEGNMACLRAVHSIKYFSRSNPTAAFIQRGTKKMYQWITESGYVFDGIVVSENTTTHMATLNNLRVREVVKTDLLSEDTDVKLNNDSKGITINVDNDTPHPSAILDIKNDSLGILIPRIAKDNRPSVPATGLLVYQIDNTPGFYYFDGNDWQHLTNTLAANANTTSIQGFSKSGMAQLSGGSALVNFDTKQNILPENLIITIQPEGDCNGLFISNKTIGGFEVKELKGGQSNVKFSYIINQK